MTSVRLGRGSIATYLMLAALTVVTVTVAPLGTSLAATTICEQYGFDKTGTYIVQNNVWNLQSGSEQCVDVTPGGFTISKFVGQAPTNGGPLSYPAVIAGCHYDNCSADTTLPAAIADLATLPTTTSVTTVPGGIYNSSYDIWLDPARAMNKVNATEIMIWLVRQGDINPVGSSVGTVTVGGQEYDVWTGNNGLNDVVSYVSTAGNTGGSKVAFKADLMDFINDTVERGFAKPEWYVNSAQLGFEPWSGGLGLTVDSFSLN